ncbi:Uncharacterised protein [Vibrio cholerae]|nr:Uncharacterised protein [Vibrio cholerae]CSI48738.1 Uncharacterised protein [Vibrio cholerae]CSI53844.1 Uncharacterised protein [Vibrio cholerae]
MNFHRGRLSATGQSADFIGNHRKTSTLFTGASCFNGGIECQKIGLL